MSRSTVAPRNFLEQKLWFRNQLPAVPPETQRPMPPRPHRSLVHLANNETYIWRQVFNIVRPVKFFHDCPESLWNILRATDVPPINIPYIVRKLCFRQIVWSEQIFFCIFWLSRKSRFRRDFARFCLCFRTACVMSNLFLKTGFERITPRATRRPNSIFYSPRYNGEMGRKPQSRWSKNYIFTGETHR